MATTDNNLQVINSMTESQLDSLKDSNGKIPDLANQLIMTDDDTMYISLPVGTIFSSAIPQTDSRVHLLDGSTILQTGVYETFANLIKALVAGGHNIAYDTNDKFEADVSTYGQCGKFVIDDTNGTIRLPLITKFIEGLSDVSKIGTLKSAGLPNITGQIGGMGNRFFINENSGAFSNNTNKANNANMIGKIGDDYPMQTYYGANFDANSGATTKGIYGNSTTVQPESVSYPYYIVLANGYKSTDVVNFDNIISELNNKQNKLTAGKGISIENGVISSFVKGAIFRKLTADMWIDSSLKRVDYNSDLASVGTGITYSGGYFYAGEGVTAMKFNFSNAFYNMTTVGYIQMLIYVNDARLGEYSLWTFYDTGLSGSGGGTILVPCKSGDRIHVQVQTSTGSGYLNNNSYVEVEAF